MRSTWCILILSFLGLAVACSEKNPAAPTPTNPGAAATLVDSANDALGSAMRTALDSIIRNGDSTFRPSDLDFTGAHTLYERAIAADPYNLDARFGAGFTEVLTIFADPDLNDLYERGKRFADTTFNDPSWALPVRRILVPGGIFGPDVFPTGFPISTRGVPGLIPDLPRLDHALQVDAAGDPQPSELQTILETRLLPKVKTAQQRLLQVTTNRNYVFWITPEMQGNLGADSIELDMTEIRLALSALFAIEAVIDVATSRHLDLPAYSLDGLNQAFNAGSDFLTLKADGEDKMSAAKTALLETLAQADSALEFLQNETDVDQSDDLIPLGNDVADIQSTLADVKSYLTQVQTVDISFLGSTLTTEVNAGRFFDAPLDDPKSYLPNYTVTFSHDTTYKVIESNYFSAQAYWDSLNTLFGVTYPNDTLVYPKHLPDVKNDAYYEVLADCQAVWGWANLYNYYPGSTECFYYYSYSQSDYQSAYWLRNGASVCLAWTASDFASWNFPDPTLNGVFPTLTNTQLKDFLYPGGDLDWVQGDCGSVGW
jgi:hypothetical protein